LGFAREISNYFHGPIQGLQRTPSSGTLTTNTKKL
jgi:hypothetical protein